MKHDSREEKKEDYHIWLSPITKPPHHSKFQKAALQHKTPPETSTDEVMTAIQLVLLNRFTVSKPICAPPF